MLPHRHLPLAVLGLLCAGGMLVACDSSPAPAPTPTPAFASDEEAFAAAEETYRAYIEAGNARNAGLAEPNPQDFLVGDALEGDIDARNYLSSIGVHLIGQIQVDSFTPSPDSDSALLDRVAASVCLDVSGTRASDADGNDVTPSERPDVLAQLVTLIHDGDHFLISEEAEGDPATCASR